MGRDLVQVRVVLFEQFCQNVFDLDIVIGSRETESGGSFQSVSRDIVQPTDQGF
jgi:hypothetical protein